MADLFNQDLFLDGVVALFALLNPLIAVPVFLGLTETFSTSERQRTAAIAGMTTAIALVTAAVLGDQILSVFGIHVPAFRIAGGLIVFTIALGMLRSDAGGAAEAGSNADTDDHRSPASVAVYPLAIPLLAGPGAFVTVIVFSARIDTMADFVTFSAAIVVISLVLWLSMAFATAAGRVLNKTAISIGTKILGILLAAVAVEMVIAGVDAHFLSRYS
ncbi:MAG: MarC family protein [Pseudomonadota bacterium]